MEPENELDAGSAREGPASPAVAAPSRLESMARTCLGHSGSAADSGLAPGAPAPPPNFWAAQESLWPSGCAVTSKGQYNMKEVWGEACEFSAHPMAGTGHSPCPQ